MFCARNAGAATLLLLLRWLAVCSIGLCSAQAQQPDAEQAFNGAAKLFQGGWYDQAEKELGAFLQAFPQSTNRNTAVLLQAQSRFQLGDFAGVISLIETRLATAGPERDQYLFWLAHAHARLDQFEPAAKRYAELLKECPASPLRLEASYGEALARFRLGDTAGTVELLNGPNSAFLESAKGKTNNPVLISGNFLLAEALFAQKNLPPAEQILTELGARKLSAEAEWQRQYLLAQIEMLDSRTDSALARVTNLVSMATAKTNTVLLAQSRTLQGEILEEEQPELAAQTYEDITKLPGLPAEQRRQALLRLVDLAVAQNRLTDAVRRLMALLEQNTSASMADLIRFTLGELHLKQYYALPPPEKIPPAPADMTARTNLLTLAQGHFNYVITHLTNSPLTGKAHLNRAWCFWEEAQIRDIPALYGECQNALRSAINRLPRSLEQAQAQFKLGDCYFQLKDYTNALTQFQLLLSQYSEFPEARERIVDHALYQVIRASVALNHLPNARTALERLLGQFPESPWGDRALFFYGQAAVEAGDFTKAHEAFTDFEKRFPDSALRPEVRLAFARSLARKADWAAAILRYDEWLAQFPTNTARAQAEFDRAWCHYQAGNETNAFVLFTNLVQRFPSSSSAPLAHYWLGDYFLNRHDYPNAEKSYQLLSTSTNSVPTGLVNQAWLMAAKAAFFRQGYSDARKYLGRLLEDPKLGPEAYSLLGDSILEDRNTTNRLAKFEEAINVFQRITNFFPGSRFAPLAMGKIAHCHFQLAAQDTNRYSMATNQYWMVVNSPLADVATRSEAEVGLGEVIVKMAEQRTNQTELLESALTHFLNVVYGRRLQKGEEPDPFWLGKAALSAGTLASERLHRFEEADRLYRTMLKVLPSLSPQWEKKLETLAKQRPR